MVSGPIGVSGFEEGEFKGYSPIEEVTVNQRRSGTPPRIGFNSLVH
jgi:hypothetical protein